MWKATHIQYYPLKVPQREKQAGSVTTRSATSSRIDELGMSNGIYRNFKNDAIKAWNQVPSEIKNAKKIYLAKIKIKKFVNTLPL